MDKIDLDGIINKNWSATQVSSDIVELRDCMKEAIDQALVLASDRAKAEGTVDEDHNVVAWVEKQSILDIRKLIV